MEGQLRITVFGKGTARTASVVLRRFVHAIKPWRRQSWKRKSRCQWSCPVDMLEEHILKELRKMLGMFANRNIISSRKKTGNRKRKCVRSVSEPCSSSKCLRLFPRGDNVQSFDKTVFNYQAEIRSTVRYHCTVLSKRFSTSSGEFSCEEMLAQHRRILFWRTSDSSQQIIKSSFVMIWSSQKLPPEIVSGNSLNILE